MSFADRAPSSTSAPIAHPRLRDLQERLLAVEIDAPAGEVARVLAAIASYDRWMREEFDQAHDHFRLLGQDNLRRYRFLREMRVRIHAADSLFDIFARACAAQATGSRVLISSPPGLDLPAIQTLDDFTGSWAGAIEFLEETDAQLATAIHEGTVERVRYAAPGRVPHEIRTAASESFVYAADAPVSAEGRIELLWYLREQSISHDYHRYGNLGARSEERRAEPL
jgi:RHH-type proline utilization regulon transcriptional repressor/proline dehydrogenase/delta 1-pyrroline-5-carboxylate dehydrogenase